MTETVTETVNADPPSEDLHCCLTPRQIEVVRLTAEGMTAKETARHLGISKNTVDQYIRQAKERAKVSTKAELVVWAVSFGLIRHLPPD